MSTPCTRQPETVATWRAGPPRPDPMSRTVSDGDGIRVTSKRSTAWAPPTWYWSRYCNASAVIPSAVAPPGTSRSIVVIRSFSV